MQGGLSPPSALGSSLLLPRPWAALLRLLLQQKVPMRTLRKLAGPVVAEEEAGLEDVIWACLPKIAKDIWLQSPHRMYSAEAEVCSRPACPTLTTYNRASILHCASGCLEDQGLRMRTPCSLRPRSAQDLGSV